MGHAYAITTLQHVVGVSPDGVVGNQTIHAVNMLDPVKIVKEYSALRMLRYTKIKNFDQYGKGWTRRLFDVALRAVSYS
jgi:lysozyme family protein